MGKKKKKVALGLEDATGLRGKWDTQQASSLQDFHFANFLSFPSQLIQILVLSSHFFKSSLPRAIFSYCISPLGTSSYFSFKCKSNPFNFLCLLAFPPFTCLFQLGLVILLIVIMFHLRKRKYHIKISRY